MLRLTYIKSSPVPTTDSHFYEQVPALTFTIHMVLSWVSLNCASISSWIEESQRSERGLFFVVVDQNNAARKEEPLWRWRWLWCKYTQVVECRKLPKKRAEPSRVPSVIENVELRWPTRKRSLHRLPPPLLLRASTDGCPDVMNFGRSVAWSS